VSVTVETVVPADTETRRADLPPEMANKIATLRSQVRESFGSVVMAMMALPRYRHQTLGDLQALVLEPLIRDRIALAQSGATAPADLSGVAIWASVSDEVDTRIREQVKAGVFPVRLKPEDWTSGQINWLLDVIAPDRATVGRMVANFGKVAQGGDLRLHPVVAGQVDKAVLERLVPGSSSG
jgi:cytolysin-activating lysine-acyltransferase